MSRPIRIHLPDLIYHVLNRGNNRQVVFAEEKDYQHYHHKYQTSGHIWQGRFKSPIVSDDEYLLTLMRYIEQNPLRAGIVEHSEKYPFSSCNANIKTEKDDLVDKEDNPAYLGLGNTEEVRLRQYIHNSLL